MGTTIPRTAQPSGADGAILALLASGTLPSGNALRRHSRGAWAAAGDRARRAGLDLGNLVAQARTFEQQTLLLHATPPSPPLRDQVLRSSAEDADLRQLATRLDYLSGLPRDWLESLAPLAAPFHALEGAAWSPIVRGTFLAYAVRGLPIDDYPSLTRHVLDRFDVADAAKLEAVTTFLSSRSPTDRQLIRSPIRSLWLHPLFRQAGLTGVEIHQILAVGRADWAIVVQPIPAPWVQRYRRRRLVVAPDVWRLMQTLSA